MRQRAMWRLAFVSLPLLASAACGTSPDAEPEDVDQKSEPIINGSPDLTHDAVVAVLGSNSVCTGTFVSKVGGYGYVLTAAHCVVDAPQQVLQCQDYNSASCNIAYNVDDYQQHPNYDNQSGLYDFAMIRVVGAGAATPTLPTMTAAQDNLAAGTQVDIIGFGQTQNNPNNSQRNHVVRAISSTSALRLFYDNQGANGGMCFGDSGGPDLASGVVAGVHSSVSGSCSGTGVSSRVSAAESFITSYIAGGPVGAMTCDQCFESSTSGVGACTGAVQQCFDDASCAALVQCLNGCSTQACADQCVSANSGGVPLYSAIYDCVCQTGCSTECASAAMCQEPTCGFTSSDANCQGCFEASCCAEATACSNDAACTTCVTTANPPASCAQNALANAFIGCLGDQCGSECGIQGGGGAGGGGSSTSTSSSSSTGSTSTSSGAGGGGGSGSTGAGGAGTGAGGAGSTSNGSTSSSGDPGPSSSSGDPGADGGCSIQEGAGSRGGVPWSALALALGLSALGRRRRSRS